jgi:hypothetical protein
MLASDIYNELLNRNQRVSTSVKKLNVDHKQYAVQF